MRSAWAGTGASATLDAGTWRAAWQDLEELVEQGQLPCCGCSSSGSPESLCPSESLRDIGLTRDGGAPVETSSAPSPGPGHVGRACSALKMHVARKGLEIRLGALPVPVQLSQQRVAQRRGRRVLPKLIQPGQSQPLPRCGLCPSLQAKANAIAGNIKEKELRRLWGDPNPTEESLALLVPCPPPLLAPLDPQLPQEHSVGGSRALGQASAVGHPREGEQELHSWHGSEEAPAIPPSALGNVVRESLPRLDGGLSPWDEECLWPFGLAMASPALPSLDNGAARPQAGPAAGSASILPKHALDRQSIFTTQRGGQADGEDKSRPRVAAPVAISRLQLSLEVRSNLWMHTARKCLEIKLQRLPAAVQHSMAMLHWSLPKAGRAGAGPPGPHSASPPLLKLKHLVQPDRDTLQQLGASLTCPAAPTTPRSLPVPLPFYGPAPRKDGGQAPLEASTLPTTACSSGEKMGMATAGAVLRIPWGMAKALAGQASTLVSPGLVPGFPATDPRPEPWRGADGWVPHGGFVAPAPGAPQGHWGCCEAQARTADGGFHHLTAAVPLEGTTSTEGTASMEGTTSMGGTMSMEGTTTSTEGTAASKPCGAEAGRKGKRWWSSRRQCPRTSESSASSGACSQRTSNSTDLQGRWPPVGLPQGMPPQTAVPPPTFTPSSPEGTPSQDSSSLQQHCRVPVTRHVCSCHLRPASSTQDTAAVLTGNTLRLVLEKICQRRRKVAPSLESSASEHSCHAVEWQRQASCSSCSSTSLCCK